MDKEQIKGCCSGQSTDGGNEGQSTCCCAGQSAVETQKILIELMYIDLTTCDRCIGADSSLDEAVAEVSNLLKSTGREIKVRKILVETEQQAEELGFVSSPTIRINGQDIQLDFKESLCGCCGEIAGEDVDCRVWIWQGKEYTTPPKAMLLDAIMRSVYAPKPENPKIMEQAVPDNLKRFFAAKNSKNGRD